MTLQVSPEHSPSAFDAPYDTAAGAFLPHLFDSELSLFSPCPLPDFTGTTLPPLETPQYAPPDQYSTRQDISRASSGNRWTVAGNAITDQLPSPLPQSTNAREVVDLTTPPGHERPSTESQQDIVRPVIVSQNSPSSPASMVSRNSIRSTEQLFESLSPPPTPFEQPLSHSIQNYSRPPHQNNTMDVGRTGFQPKTRPPSHTLNPPPAKRRRTERNISNLSGTNTSLQDNEEVESIDLTDVADRSALSDALAKQREDAIRAQGNNSRDANAGRSSLTSYKCPVCMDVPENATITICGMLSPSHALL